MLAAVVDVGGEGEALWLRKACALLWKPAAQPEVASSLLAACTGVRGGHGTGGCTLRQRGEVGEGCGR
jgi:hypothetical protein